MLTQEFVIDLPTKCSKIIRGAIQKIELCIQYS